MNERSTTIKEAYVQASSFLKQHNISNGDYAAKLMLQHILGCDSTGLFMAWDKPFGDSDRQKLEVWLKRRIQGEPVQYIVGEQDFYGLAFAVNPVVLIPRPETELLVEEVLRRGKAIWPNGRPLLLDVGTGSGAIPVTAAAHCPQWRIYASDISAEALEVARLNAARHGAAVRFLQGDLLEPAIECGLAVDILVSNPPYIPTGDLAGLEREVRDHEPHTALFGGEDGLDLYRRMLAQVERLVQAPRLIAFEVGLGQAREVERMLHEIGYWRSVRIINDLAGIERHVIGEVS